MNCPIERGEPGVVLDYAARKLSAESALAFERHMAGCAECHRLAEAQIAVWGAMDAWNEVPVSPDFNRRLYARIEQEELRQNVLGKWARTIAARWSPFSWRPALPVAAVCATVLTAFLIQSPDRALVRNEPEVKVESINAEQVERALDDMDMLKQLGAVIEAKASKSM